MRTLSTSYKKNGHLFNLIEREGDIAIYEQIEPDSGKRIAYEVFEIQRNEARTIAGKDIEAGESCPGNEQWGRQGFTVYDLKDAKEKQGILAARVEERKKQASVEAQN